MLLFSTCKFNEKKIKIDGTYYAYDKFNNYFEVLVNDSSFFFFNEKRLIYYEIGYTTNKSMINFENNPLLLSLSTNISFTAPTFNISIIRIFNISMIV